jgi:hypothetical protein
MPDVRQAASPGMLDLVGPALAYHADDEIARAVAIGEIVIAAILVVIAIALLMRLRGAPTEGRNRMARIAATVAAVGIAAYVANRVIPYGDDPGDALLVVLFALLMLMLAVGVAGPFLAILGLERVRTSGERVLAVAAFVASLVLPGIFIANVIACAVTDACFH